MNDIVLQENGKVRRVGDVEMAEDIVKKRNTKDPWTVIDNLIKIWAKVSPDEEQAVKINVEQYRESQKDSSFAQTENGKDQERRFVLAFPRSLMLMIRTQYKAEELPMDSKFFKEFGRRYPAFKVAEKI